MTSDISQFRIKKHRICIISHNVSNAVKIFDVLNAWETEVLLVGTVFVYRQLKNLLPKMRERVRFHLFYNINSIILEQEVREFNPHYIMSYGCYRKIPDAVLQLAHNTTFNFHPSLLPMYKGASPQTLPIENNDDELGVTVHEMTSEYDAGPILLQLREVLPPLATQNSAGEIYNRLIFACFVQLFTQLDQGELTRSPNPIEGYPDAPRRMNKDFWFNPESSAVELDRLVRARTGKDSMPAVLVIGRSVLHIEEVILCDNSDDIPEAANLVVGQLIYTQGKGLLRCQIGFLWITVVYQILHGTMSFQRYATHEKLHEGKRLHLRYPGKRKHLARLEYETAQWYVDRISQYYK